MKLEKESSSTILRVLRGSSELKIGHTNTRHSCNAKLITTKDTKCTKLEKESSLSILRVLHALRGASALTLNYHERHEVNDGWKLIPAYQLALVAMIKNQEW